MVFIIIYDGILTAVKIYFFINFRIIPSKRKMNPRDQTPGPL